MIGAARAVARGVRTAATAATSTGTAATFQDRMADALRAFAGPVLLVLSEHDLTAREFADYAGSDARWQGLLGQANVTRTDIAGADHTFSTARWRDEVENSHARLAGARPAGGFAMRRVLMVAYHFPPLAGSSGIQRTLRFVQHLPAFGWEPIVLTAHPRAYEAVSDDLVPAVAPAGRGARARSRSTPRATWPRRALPGGACAARTDG